MNASVETITYVIYVCVRVCKGKVSIVLHSKPGICINCFWTQQKKYHKCRDFLRRTIKV